MAETAPHAPTVRRTFIALVIVLALLHLAGTTGLLSEVTRPLVVGALRLLGVSADDREGELRGGRMHVPWSRDCAGVNLLLMLPFVAMSLTALWRPSLRPPNGVMARSVAPNTYEVRLVGQPQAIQMLWYGPSGDGRHHTLPVCMRYRGVDLKPSGAEETVLTDGEVWMREFFIQGDTLLPDYRSYLQRTLWPWSSAGVHLIANASTNHLTAQAFALQVGSLARELHRVGRPVEVRTTLSAAERPKR